MKAFLSRFQAKKLRQRSRQWRQNNCLRTQWRGGVDVMANGVSSIEMPFECEAIVVLFGVCAYFVGSRLRKRPIVNTMTMHILVCQCSIRAGRFLKTIDNIVMWYQMNLYSLFKSFSNRNKFRINISECP